MIGILDSGIGGLGLARAIQTLAGAPDLLYLGDSARSPYGVRSAACIQQDALQGARWLAAQGVEGVLLACDAIAAAAGDVIRQALPLPVWDIVRPAAAAALTTCRKPLIGVLASPAAITAGAHAAALQAGRPDTRVFGAACPLLIPLIEHGWRTRPETVRMVKKYLHPLKVRQIDTLIVGSPHLDLLTPVIQRKIGRRVSLVRTAPALIQRLQQPGRQPVFPLRPPDGPPAHLRVCVTDLTDLVRQSARQAYGRHVPLELVRVG